MATGHRFLGGFLGRSIEIQDYVLQKVRHWCAQIRVLAAVSVSQPQASFIALTRSLQSEWMFLMRVIPNCSPILAELEHCLYSCFLPALLILELKYLLLKGSYLLCRSIWVDLVFLIR